jgi:hypothetical protein
MTLSGRENIWQEGVPTGLILLFYGLIRRTISVKKMSEQKGV